MGGIDKTFAHVHGRPLLAWTVDVFERCPAVDEIVVAVSRHSIQEGRALAQAEGWRKVSQVCRGGLRRQDSVREALWRLGRCDWVLVHDGARPCMDAALITTALEAARPTGAAIPGLPVSDTLKRAGEDGIVQETVDRRGVWAVQTPQAFRYAILWRAYEAPAGEATDDAALVEQQGVQVKLFPGSPRNIKVTVAADLELAGRYLQEAETSPS